MPESAHPPLKIFISYRRKDNHDFAERIRDWFAWRYGRENVFIDFDSIRPAANWGDVIRQEISKCDALIAIIGPQWLKLLNDAAHKPDEDYVRLEIKLALQQAKIIAPVCIKGAEMPAKDELPEDLRPIFKSNFYDLNSGLHFLDNIERLMDSIEHVIIEEEAKKVIEDDVIRAQRIAGFDVREAIQQFEMAEAVSDWETALKWLRTIEQSGYEPESYPVADYIGQMEEKIARQRAEVDYDVIRSLVKRVERGRATGEQVLRSLEKFWASHPLFDPDNLAERFRPPQKIHAAFIESTEAFFEATVTVENSPIQTIELNDAFFNQLAEIDAVESNQQFEINELALASPNPDSAAELTLEQARALGLLDNL
jgi:hypothetical protein